MSFEIGKAIAPGMSVDEQLAISGLDWQVSVTPLQSEFQGRIITEPDLPVLRRGDTGEFLTIAGRGWKPYSNRRFMTDFNDFCDRAGFKIDRAGFLTKGGGRNKDAMSFASAVIPAEHNGEFDINGDTSQMRILFLNHFSYGKGVGAFIMNERIFCQNQLVLKPYRERQRTLSHASNNVEGTRGIIKIRETLQGVASTISDYWGVSQSLAATPISEREAIDFFINTFGDREKSINEQAIAVQTMIGVYFDEVKTDLADFAMDTPSVKNTAYGLLNAVTAYETHLTGYSSRTGRPTMTNESKFLNRLNGLSTKAYGKLQQQYVRQSVRV